MRSIGVAALSGVLVFASSSRPVRYDGQAKAPAVTREIVAIYFGTAGTDRMSGMATSIPAMKVALARQAGASGRRFISRGVSLEPTIEDGLTDLALLGPFDEISLGGNWKNAEVGRYFGTIDQVNPHAAIPQVVVIEREVREESASIQIGAEREIARYIGADKIANWVKSGAPLP
jgi:hypothetical protein